jgi:hypothetical protein
MVLQLLVPGGHTLIRLKEAVPELLRLLQTHINAVGFAGVAL